MYVLQRLLLLAMLLLCFACRNAVVNGRVLDPFGKAVTGAAVTIEGTGFISTTDGKGRYSIKFAPGQFSVKIRKPGHSSATLPFNVTESTEVPAADVTLYPIPTDPGLYYMAPTQLAKLPSARIRVEKNQGPWSASFRYYAEGATDPKFAAGEHRFIDTTGRDVRLAKILNHKGMFLDVVYHLMAPEEKASGFIKDTSERVGDEQLVIRRAKLDVGQDAWIEIGGGPVMGSRGPKETSYTFQVGDAIPWFSYLGSYAYEWDPNTYREPYRVSLWLDPSAGVVGHVDYPLQEADTPTGAISGAKYDPKTEALSFRARVYAGQSLEGVPSNDVHEFVGQLKGDVLEGTFTRRDENAKTAPSSARVTLKREPTDNYLAEFESLQAWQEQYSKPVLEFRGPR